MNNFESTGDASSTESTEREDFAKVDARLDEIKGMNMGDMSDDDLENVMAERKALRAQKEEMVGAAQVEATAEGQVREVYDEAHQENQEINEAEQKRAEAEKAAAEAIAQAEQAEQSAIKRQAELAQADALLAEIKGGGVEKNEAEIKDVPQEQQTENVEEKLNNANLSLMSLFESAGYSSFRDKVSDAEKSVIGLPEGEQEKLAEKFFEQTIGKNIRNNKGAYQVYLEIGGAFHKKFAELEDARLKSAGYSSGFTI